MPAIHVDDIGRTAVIGAGEMGRGIAAVAALAGYETMLQDIDEGQLAEAEEHVDWSYGKAVERGEIDGRRPRPRSTTSGRPARRRSRSRTPTS